MKIGFIADPLGTFNTKKDSTYSMMVEASRRGHEIHARLVAISEVGVEIECQLGFALLGMAGEPVELTAAFDRGGEPWTLRGHVQFVRASKHSLVIEYDTPAPVLGRLLESQPSD